MSYALGIDLGTTYTAAAVARNGRAEVAALGYRATSVPTVVLLTEDGRFLVGDAAERRGAQEPQRLAREFKRRVGDPTPIMLGGTPIAVDRCLAEVLRWVVATIGEAEGGPPAAVTVTHPANWGEFKRDVLREALRMVDVDDYRLLPEPVAAATWYAQTERLAPGRTVAVYDLGGGTFDATVLRRRADGQFESLGRTEGIDRLGGIDVDEAVFRYVLRSVGEDATDLAQADEDPRLLRAAAQLRRACVEAKEALSSETSVTIPVWLPGVQHQVLLQRAELEDLVGPLLRPTVDALARVVTSAGLRPDDLDAVLLVGGSSRIPLISRQVSAAFGRPIAVDAHPKHPVALGAALDADAHRSPSAGAGAAGAAAGAAAAALATAPLLAPGAPPGPGGPPSPPTVPMAHASATAPTAPTAPPGPPSASAPSAPSGPPGPPGPPSWGGMPSGQYGTSWGPGMSPVSGFPAPSGSGGDAYGARRLVIAGSAIAVVVTILVALVLIRGDRNSGLPDESADDPGTTAATIANQGEGGTTSAEGGGTTVPASTTSTLPPGGNLLTSGLGPVFEAWNGIHDTPAQAYEVVVFPDGYGFARLQVPGEPTHVDEYTWRDGQVSGPEIYDPIDDGEDLQASYFPLADIDPAVIPGLVEQTPERCGPGLDLVVSHVIISRDITFDPQQRVLITVFSDNERSEGSFIEYTLDGTLVDNACVD